VVSVAVGMMMVDQELDDLDALALIRGYCCSHGVLVDDTATRLCAGLLRVTALR
jgi:hypothetical protein